MRNLVVKSLIISSLLTGGCASVDSNIAGDSLSPTGVSAATGAILGGGLGAIVGSTSGDAGAGLVIGSVAGAATGGLIGNSFEEQQKELKETEEVLNRQQETIQSQTDELQQLRKQLDEQLAENNRPSSFRGQDYSLSEYSGNPRATRLSPSASQFAANTTNVGESDINISEQNLPKATQQTTASLPKPRARLANNDTLAARKAELVAAKKVTPVKTVQPQVVSKPEIKTQVAKKVERITKEEPKATLPKVEEPKEIQTAKAVVDPSCRRAQKEAEKAVSARSAADRLYYYRRALRFCPSEADYHVEIGKVYMSVGRSKDAAYEFEQALRLTPEHSEGQKLLAQAKEGE